MTRSDEQTIDIFGATLTRSRFVKGAGALVVAGSVLASSVGAKAAQAESTMVATASQSSGVST